MSVRPAPDGMSYLTAVLPMPHATSVHAALNQATDTAGDGRLRGHVMADTLVERITGRPADVAVSVAVNVVITDDTLLAGNTTPARVPGYGPVPASIARQLVTTALWDARSRVTLRRLYRHPSSGALVAMQSRARLFPTSLATFIDTRDDVCRTPYCDAPIRHHDHATPNARGGATSAANGLGLCEACNYTKEAPGWQVSPRSTKRAPTEPNSPPPPAPNTNPTPHRCSPASTSSRSPTSKPPSASAWSTTPPKQVQISGVSSLGAREV